MGTAGCMRRAASRRIPWPVTTCPPGRGSGGGAPTRCFASTDRTPGPVFPFRSAVSQCRSPASSRSAGPETSTHDQKASSMTSICPPVMDTTSNRIWSRPGHVDRRSGTPCEPERRSAAFPSASHRVASGRIRRCLDADAASAPVPKRSLERTFTSENTRVAPRLRIRSSSPSGRRQFAPARRRHRFSYQRTASDYAPRAPDRTGVHDRRGVTGGRSAGLPISGPDESDVTALTVPFREDARC